MDYIIDTIILSRQLTLLGDNQKKVWKIVEHVAKSMNNRRGNDEILLLKTTQVIKNNQILRIK
jgi:hypothetical protein